MIIVIRINKIYIYILLLLVLIFFLALVLKDSIIEYFKISYRNYYNIHISKEKTPYGVLKYYALSLYSSKAFDN